MNKYYAAKVDELLERGRMNVLVKGLDIGLFAVDGVPYAWRNLCPHAGAPVCMGKRIGTTLPSEVYRYVYGKEQEVVRCPWHGWEFDLRTGKHLAAGSNTKLRGYELAVEDGNIYLLLD